MLLVYTQNSNNGSLVFKVRLESLEMDDSATDDLEDYEE